ncbi:MAG: aminoacyl-tRNA hydrolase [Planctomycetes bacterium]|nr:aminoacyl-tRNA hydrolase [Planctomycetota bacterium]
MDRGVMQGKSMIKVTKSLFISPRELKFIASTGSGPGGQHVNRVATKIVLLWDVDSSENVSTAQKNRIKQKLSTRINKAGVLRVTSSKHRSQKANKEATIARFALLLSEALATKKTRKKTKVSSSQREKRLESKKKRGVTKRLRARVQPDKH